MGLPAAELSREWMAAFRSHRWEYALTARGHRCVAPAWGSGSVDRCVGCGEYVADEDLLWFLGGQGPGTILLASLDGLAAAHRVGLERERWAP